MSLITQYKNDVKAITDGAWINFEKNTDGTTPRFRIARASKLNRRYTAEMQRLAKLYQGENGEVDTSNVSEDEAERLQLEAFVDTLLTDWEHFQPEDDGNDVKFNRENAIKLLGSPEWADLLAELVTQANKAGNFREKATVALAKNS